VADAVGLDAHELDRFTLPHSVRLVGEHQDLVGGGSLSVAVNLRLAVEVEPAEEGPSLVVWGEPPDPEAEPLPWPEQTEPGELCERWRRAMLNCVAGEAALLEEIRVEVDFGPLWATAPPQVLLRSPALAAALAVIVRVRGDELPPEPAAEVAELACRLYLDAFGEEQDASRFYSDALMSLVGGAGYAEPAGERLNVQQLLPPDSLLLALAPDVSDDREGRRCRAGAWEALSVAARAGCDVTAEPEAFLRALFSLEETLISPQQSAMLYGLVRVRQMMDTFLETLGLPFVDNDRLAEMCDEESAILTDYFAFPAGPYERIRAEARDAGALGAKLTYAFGAYPAAIIVCPARRAQVQGVLERRFPDAVFLPLELDPDGLTAYEPEAGGPAP